MQGASRKLTVNTPAQCTTCDGVGQVRGQPCPTCDGTGQMTKSRVLEVRIPKGVRTGSRVRIAGQGGAGLNGGPNGDVYLMITIAGDSRFTPNGTNLETTLDVPLYTAILGGEVRLDTPTGRVMLTIPRGTQNGKVFRLRGKGLPANGDRSRDGDLLATTRVMMPTELSPKEEALFTELRDLRR